MYLLGDTFDKVHQYSLSQSWNVSTLSYDDISFDVTTWADFPLGFFFKPDGFKMYVSDFSGAQGLSQYNLSTPWVVSSASFDNNFTIFASGFFFKSDGLELYVTRYDSDAVYQYTLSQAWNLSTASYNDATIDISGQEGGSQGISFKSDGTKMYIIGTSSDMVHQYSLSQAWNVSTASYDNVNFSVNSEDGSPNGIFFNETGNKMYMVGTTSDTIYQYTLPLDSTPPTHSSAQVNETCAGRMVNFSILYDDNIALHQKGQYNFSTNNTGVWINSSVVNFTTTPQFATNLTILNSTSGLTIGYRWYTFDNATNWNNTGINILITTTCDYTRDITQPFTTTSLTDKLSSLIKTITQYLTITDLIGRFKGWYISIQESITMTNIVNRLISFLRNIPQSFSMNIIIDRIASFFKTIPQSFTTTSLVDRLRGVERTVTQEIIMFSPQNKTYNFSGTFNSLAYNNTVEEFPPGVFTPAGETEINYTKISTSDDDHATDISSDYPYHKFNISIEETGVNYVDVWWEGYTSSTGNASLYVWNYTLGNWSLLDYGNDTIDFNLTSRVSDLNNVRMGVGNITFLVQDGG